MTRAQLGPVPNLRPRMWVKVSMISANKKGYRRVSPGGAAVARDPSPAIFTDYLMAESDDGGRGGCCFVEKVGCYICDQYGIGQRRLLGSFERFLRFF